MISNIRLYRKLSINLYNTLCSKLQEQRGQATSESAVLLVTTLCATAGFGGWLLSSHPAWLNALNIHIRGFYYLLSLPFP